MTGPRTHRLARLGSDSEDVSIAAVFGVEWIFNLFACAKNAAWAALQACFRIISADRATCAICDEYLWKGDLVSCSNNRDSHWYCLECYTKTIKSMLSGDVALTYDPSTTLPLCCYCPSGDPGRLPIEHLSMHLQRSWDRAIVAKQLHGLPLLTCAHCSYIVIDESEQPVRPDPASEGLRRRWTQALMSYVTTPSPPRQFHCPECDWLTCLPPEGCGNAFQASFEDHRCKTDDLRLEIEKAVDKRLIYRCPSCSSPLVKDGGCNHCTCTCGAEYCHLCHANLGRNQTIWKSHFCGHVFEDDMGRCTTCSKCPLYSDRDDAAIRRKLEDEVTRRWRRQQLWDGVKKSVGW